MPDAVAVAVRKAAAAEIISAAAAGQLSQQFVVEQSWAEWSLELDGLNPLEARDSDKLRVDVVAHTTEQTVQLQARGGRMRYQVPIDMAVRRRFGADKQDDDTGRIAVSEVDSLLLLVQELHLLFTPARLTDYEQAVWDQENGGTRIMANPVREHLKDHRQFTGLIRVMFRVDV